MNREHRRSYVAPLLGGQAKAMVVVASRLEAVRWQRAVQKYIDEHGYKMASLVAFSGEVSDSESGSDPFTETSSSLNPYLKGRDIRDAFANGGEYQLLLVANTFPRGKPVTLPRRASTSRCSAACTSTGASRASRRCRHSRA